MGPFFVGAGYLVGAIGIGTMVAGYLYPSTGEELTNAVEGYEKEIILGRNHKKLLNNLEELRKNAGLTQQELSESAEVSRKASTQLRMVYMFPPQFLL